MYTLVGADMPYSMGFSGQATAHLMVTRRVARGAFYKARDVGAYTNFGGGVGVVLLTAEYICVSCARVLDGIWCR